MDTESSYLSEKEAEQKVKLMVDCMKYHLDDVECLKKSLLSISLLCSSHNNITDYLRVNGCLQFIYNLFTSCESAVLKKSTLFCLACAISQNVYSQRHMMSECIFDHLHKIFQDKTSEKSLCQTAAFFISSIAANNGIGQLNCKLSSCLSDLIDLFRELLPKEILSEKKNEIILGNITLQNADLFTTVCNAICACTNNPRNEENQDLCANLILYPSLRLIQRCPHMPSVQSILNLMAVIVAGNTTNQEKIRELNGIHILSDLLRIFTMASVENADFLKIAVSVTSTLDSCLLDNASNAEQFGSCGGIKSLVSLLQCCSNRCSHLLPVILSVAHATDNSSMNQNRFTECGGLAILLPLLTESVEEELLATVKYVLQICVPDGSSQTENIIEEYNTGSEGYVEDCQKRETIYLSEKLEAILQRLDKIENGGYKTPSVVVSSDVKAMPKKKYVNTEMQQIDRARASRCDKQGDQHERDNNLSDNLHIEASNLEKRYKSLDGKHLFKKPQPVISKMYSKSVTSEKTNLESISTISLFDINLVTTAKGYQNKRPSSEHSASSVLNSSGKNTENMQKNTVTQDEQCSVSHTTPCTSLKERIAVSRAKRMTCVCPGGAPPSINGRLLLNSRNYNNIIESNPNVCIYHRLIRKIEREWIRKTVKKNTKKEKLSIPIKGESKCKENSDVFECISSDEQGLTPPDYDSDHVGTPLLNKLKSYKMPRRKAVRYSEEEIKNLKEGVEKMGTFWIQILNAYKFHPSRTATDLAYKYKQMKKKKLKPQNPKEKKIFSLCEERRLERGVKKFGHSWSLIWKKYRFGPDKLPEDLRLKWRVLNK